MTRRILLACLLLLACGLGLAAWLLTDAGGELSGSGHPSGHEGPSQGDPEAAPALASAPESGPPAPVERTEVEVPATQRGITYVSSSTPFTTTRFGAFGAVTEEPFPEPRTVGFLVQDEQGQPIRGAEITAMGSVWNLESVDPPTSPDRTVLFKGAKITGNGSARSLESLDLPTDPGRTKISGLTDEHGLWTIESRYPVFANHVVASGFVHGTLSVSDGPRTAITLLPGLQITGRVLEAGSLLPVANATVSLTGLCNVCGQGEVRTDGVGRFTSGRVVVGSRIGLQIQAPGFIPERSKFELTDADSATVQVSLRRGAVVWLEFFDLDTGAPLRKVRIKGETRQWSDARGRVRSSALIAADEQDMTLTASLSHYPAVQFTLKPLHLNPVIPVRIPMARARTLAGLISDPSGAPLERVRVRVKVLSGKDVERLWREEHRAAFDDAPRELHYLAQRNARDHTWASGKFKFSHLPPWTREVELRIAHPGYVEASWRTQLDPGLEPTWREWTLTPTTGATSPADEAGEPPVARDVR